MNVAQKRAWFTVIVFAVSLAAFLILIPIVGIKMAYPAWSIFGLAGLQLFLYRKKTPDKVEMDERDREIHRRAALGAGMASYLVFIIACMGTWDVCYYRWHQETISIHVLPTIVMAGGIAFFVSQAIVLLIGYGRENRHEDA
jgi:hypothetical protein